MDGNASHNLYNNTVIDSISSANSFNSNTIQHYNLLSSDPSIAKNEYLVNALKTCEEVQHINPIHPWSEDITEECPEDVEEFDCCTFKDFLDHASIDLQQHILDYKAQIKEHVHSDFIKEVPEIIEFLHSDIAISVFANRSWSGIVDEKGNNIIIDLKFLNTLPNTIKARSVHFNPKNIDNVNMEFERLKEQKFFVSCKSPYTSPLLIVPKATEPFVRLVVDYRNINQYIENINEYIPSPELELLRASDHDLFHDIDMKTAFHQILISDDTSYKLAVQTHKGVVRPRFLPEGITPATNILMSIVRDIFADFSEWMIVIHDNFLILCKGFQDAFSKLVMVITKASKHNLHLNFKKSWLGSLEINFFGYKCTKGFYGIDPNRTKAIALIQFPTSILKMQKYLGVGNFCAKFVPGYASIVADLYDMTHKSFSFNKKTWCKDYESTFIKSKDAIIACIAKHYPNYALTWLLICDASKTGCAALLVQRLVINANDYDHQVIGISSHKFSPAAAKWATNVQELYSLLYGFEKFGNIISGKEILLITDHRNFLAGLEKATNPKIIRWFMKMKSFSFKILHWKGNKNPADFFSRPDLMGTDNNDTDIDPTIQTFSYFTNFLMMEHSFFASNLQIDNPHNGNKQNLNATELVMLCHSDLLCHRGISRTYKKLCETFPGHKIPVSFVTDVIATCSVCQKARIGMVHTITPLIRNLRVDNERSTYFCDILTISPKDMYGMLYLVVIINAFTKFTMGYPMASHTAENVALAIFQHCCTFGVVRFIQHDPGSEFTSEIQNHLLEWLGISHACTLVDSPKSNGVERTNGTILNTIRCIVEHKRWLHMWSSQRVLGPTFYLLNHEPHGETSIAPAQGTFGTLSSNESIGTFKENISNEFVQELDENLKEIRIIIANNHKSTTDKRAINNPSDVSQINTYQAGDYVLKNNVLPNLPRRFKLETRCLGPFKVISQFKDEVTIKNIITDVITIVKVDELKTFFGSDEEAFTRAQSDNNQYVISHILSYKGDPEKRSTCEFQVLFMDGTISWLLFTEDLSSTIQFEDFIRARLLLRYTNNN